MSTKVKVDLDIGEMWALVDYHNQISRSIPLTSYNIKNKAGTTMGDTARKHLERAQELSKIVDETWPK
jgi:hypothetical protein